MTNKQRLFASEYMKDLNAVAAALRAGYAKNTARTAYQWVTPDSDRFKTELYLAVQRQLDEVAERNKLSVDRIVRVLLDIAEADPRDVAGIEKLSDLPDSIAKAVSSIDVITSRIGEEVGETTYKFRFWNKTAATQQLGAYLKMWGKHQDKGNNKDQLPVVSFPGIGQAHKPPGGA